MFGRLTVLMLLLILFMTWNGHEEKERKTLPVVASVDLAKYVGQWYEIARLPNRFEKACVSSVTATYPSAPTEN